MDYQNTIEFAEQMDANDPLKHFRQRFHIPQHQGRDAVYFCGNSLGLQPVSVQEHLQTQLDVWRQIAIEGFFEGAQPWLNYHKRLRKKLAPIVGALETEVSIMNSLTVNLHLLLVSFYQPTKKRYKILMEGNAFPSDQYAIETQVKFHGFDPADAIIEVPVDADGRYKTANILATIAEHQDELALVLFSGINYINGQFFDLAAISKTAHKAGAYVGFDLAHAAGNVPLQLHNWDVDFAVWCSYKYLNSGPGGIGGIFVNQKHFNDTTLPRFSGWWGYEEGKRFLMAPGFVPEQGADGWQLSTSPVMLLALHEAALNIFEKAGGVVPLRGKSILLTGYLEFLINQINQTKGEELFRIITPTEPDSRGCQLSIVCKQNARQIFDFITARGIIGDWREPNVIRLSPVPLYNTFKDVFVAAGILLDAVEQN